MRTDRYETFEYRQYGEVHLFHPRTTSPTTFLHQALLTAAEPGFNAKPHTHDPAFSHTVHSFLHSFIHKPHKDPHDPQLLEIYRCIKAE